MVAIRMENHLGPILGYSGTSRAIEIEIACPEKLSSSPGIRAAERWRCGILDIVLGRYEAMGRIEQVVDALRRPDEIGGLDQLAILVAVMLENLHRIFNRSSTVVFEFLQHDWDRLEGWFAVVAPSAISDAISVDFVDDIKLSIDIFKRGGINGTALV